MVGKKRGPTKGAHCKPIARGFAKNLKAWGVIIDGAFLIGAGQTQEEARVIRERWISEATINHRLFARADVNFIYAKVVNLTGPNYHSRSVPTKKTK